jgi:hypothetical protein
LHIVHKGKYLYNLRINYIFITESSKKNLIFSAYNYTLFKIFPDPHTIEYKYTPEQAGKHVVMITWAGKEIPRYSRLKICPLEAPLCPAECG